jgi:hypothetical protein
MSCLEALRPAAVLAVRANELEEIANWLAVEQLMIALSPRRCPGHKPRVEESDWPHVQGID